MTETLIVSGGPGLTPLRYIWLFIVARTIALWGCLVSIVLPIVKQQPGPPPEVETFASRYRLMTPDLPRHGEESSESHPRGAMLPRHSSRTPSFDSLEHDPSNDGHIDYGFASLSTRRSYSTTACHGSRSLRVRTDDSAARPRSNSDPTGTSSRAALRARRCMSIASAVASKSATPARPIIKRARTVLQRTMSTYEGGDDNEDDDGDEGRASGPGVGTRTKVAIQEARTRTVNAMNRTATAATTAILTASQKITPTAKGAAEVDPNVCEADFEVEVEKKVVVVATEDTLPKQTLSQRRPKAFSRKFTMFTSSRIFTRRRS